MYSEVNIIGRVGSKGTMRVTNSGSTLVSVSVVVNKKYQSRAGGWMMKAIWVRIAFWNKLAEVVDKYVEKGDRIFVSGELEEPYAYEKEGELAATVQVTARSLILIESRDKDKDKDKDKDIYPKGIDDKTTLPSTEELEAGEDIPF